jgi:CYTH domain-containing protein
MPKEIERKFLVKGDSWRGLAKPQFYQQGYIDTINQTTIRIRIVGEKGFLTIKGKSQGIARSEYEYQIPLADAQQMLQELCQKPQIQKNRYQIQVKELLWDVDEFLGDNSGLIIAEVELEKEDQIIELPEWIAQEVSLDPRYFNYNLTKFPYKNW